eukprot:TRINITY_DN2908_c1_g1_i1.p1 TRINITY_DN2908_c1_g1~~TRINITY_DN2908_c1_g1_i1.p1  ORF type:complete len:509 (+),score=132.82 TRINITY_DN2908_c1_g1_i1:187-1527(+)
MPAADECAPLPQHRQRAVADVAARFVGARSAGTPDADRSASGVVTAVHRLNPRRLGCATAAALRCAATCDCRSLLHSFASPFMQWTQEDQLQNLRCAAVARSGGRSFTGASLSEWLHAAPRQCCLTWDSSRRWHNCSQDLSGEPLPAGAPPPLPVFGGGGENVLLMGDSLTRATHGRDARDAWLDGLGGWAGRLRRLRPERRPAVVNVGVATESTHGLLNRLWMVFHELRRTADGASATVFLLSGTNDLLIDGFSAVDTAIRNIGLIAAALRAAFPSVKVVLQTVPPVADTASPKEVHPRRFRAAAAMLNSGIVSVAARESVCVLDLAGNVFGFDTPHAVPDKALFLGDGLHLSAVAYERWTRLLAAELSAGRACATVAPRRSFAFAPAPRLETGGLPDIRLADIKLAEPSPAAPAAARRSFQPHDDAVAKYIRKMRAHAATAQLG